MGGGRVSRRLVAPAGRCCEKNAGEVARMGDGGWLEWGWPAGRDGPSLGRMSPTFREQISSTIQETEHKLDQLRAQPQPNEQTIEGNEKELQILKRKLQALPEERSQRQAMYA